MRLALLTLLLPALAQAQDVTPAVQALYADAQAQQKAGRSDAAIADYRKITAEAPSLTAAWNNLGRLLYNTGRFPDAVAALRQALALQPGLPPAELMLGASLLQMGQLADAQPALAAAVEAFPQDRFARLTYARVLTGLHRPQEAIAQLEAALTTDPKDQEAWYLLGNLHLELSREALAKVQALDPDTPLAHRMQGELMESMSNTPGAVAEYKEALAQAPNDTQSLEHLVDVYWKTGDWAHAREQLSLLLQKQPGNCYAHWKLGNTLAELGEPPEAGLKEVNTALEQCPEIAQARAERARLYLRQGKAAEAIPDLKAAEQAAPDEASVQRLLAQAYRATGDKAQAAAADKRFLALQAAQHEAEEKHQARVTKANQ